MAVLNNFNDNVKIYNLEPYVIIDGLSGTTRYICVSIVNDINAPIWKIKKEWQIGNVQYMGFPNGDQSNNYAWSGRTGYTYR
jgi:hypothetical protein